MKVGPPPPFTRDEQAIHLVVVAVVIVLPRASCPWHDGVTSSNHAMCDVEHGIMRLESTTKVLATHVFKYCRIPQYIGACMC